MRCGSIMVTKGNPIKFDHLISWYVDSKTMMIYGNSTQPSFLRRWNGWLSFQDLGVNYSVLIIITICKLSKITWECKSITAPFTRWNVEHVRTWREKLEPTYQWIPLVDHPPHPNHNLTSSDDEVKGRRRKPSVLGKPPKTRILIPIYPVGLRIWTRLRYCSAKAT